MQETHAHGKVVREHPEKDQGRLTPLGTLVSLFGRHGKSANDQKTLIVRHGSVGQTHRTARTANPKR